MLTARPNSWFSWNCEIYEEEHLVGSMAVDWFREAGRIRVHQRRFSVRRAGFMSGAFVLSDEHGTVASAVKPSAFARVFVVDVNGLQFRLRSASPFAFRQFVVESGGLQVGSIRPGSIFSRRMLIDLPADLPVEARIFMAWLVAIIWRRQHNASTG